MVGWYAVDMNKEDNGIINILKHIQNYLMQYFFYKIFLSKINPEVITLTFVKLTVIL